MTVFLFFGCYISPFHTPQKCWSFSSGKSHGKSPWVCWGKPQHFRPEAPPSSTSIWTWPQVSGWGCPGPGVSTMKGSFKLEFFVGLRFEILFFERKIWENPGDHLWEYDRFLWIFGYDSLLWSLRVNFGGSKGGPFADSKVNELSSHMVKLHPQIIRKIARLRRSSKL